MKAIPGYEGLYYLTEDGRVWSHPRVVKRTGPMGKTTQVSGRFLIPRPLPKGYYRVQLSKNNKQEDRLIHRLMAATFLPFVEGKNFVNHKNFDVTDNRPENLEWVTMEENVGHSLRAGRMTGRPKKI